MATRSYPATGSTRVVVSLIRTLRFSNRHLLRLLSAFTILTSLLSLGFGPVALTESDAARMPVYPYQLKQLGPVPPPSLTAKAAVIMDSETGRVLYDRNAHLRVAPASTTKLMTALLAMEQNRLKEKVTIEWKMLVGWASMGLQVGDVLTIEDLLWGVMLPSANEAAEAIATHLGGGSSDNFVKMMNDKAAEMGLRDTQFKNPHGLDEVGHYSSAYDLALIARAAMKYPLLNSMAATKETTVYASRQYKLLNTNSLLQMQNSVPGIDGFKTGMTGDAGNCLVATATRHGHRLITVVMGAVSRNRDTIELMNYGFDRFVWETLPSPAATKIQGDEGRARSIELPPKREVLIRPWEKWWISLNLSLSADRSSAKSGPSALVGLATYSIAGTAITEYPVRLRD